MKLPRRKFLHLAAGAAALPALPRRASALDYPTRPVHIVVGYPAGSGPDVLARLMGQGLSERMARQFVVENKPGAGTKIATEDVVKATPDGYTLLLSTSANAVDTTLYPNLIFNFIRDVAPVGMIGVTPFVMVVNPSVPAKDLQEFIAYAKANPGKINMASRGNGTVTHVVGELLKMTAGIDLVHVPYRGDYMADVLGGQVQVAFFIVASSIEYIRDGRLRALAVTGPKRMENLPDVPAVDEILPGYDATAWNAIGAPKDTSVEIIQRLNEKINAVVAGPGMKGRLAGIGVEPMPMTPVELGKLIAKDVEKWAKVIKFANIKPE